jgi:soluble lytic murein transglycosylase
MKIIVFFALFSLLLSIGVKVCHQLFPIDFVVAIHSGSKEADLDPFLIAAMIRVESSFRPFAQSAAGAFGPMQLLPSTARWFQEQINLSGDWMDPYTNIRLGALYFRYLLDQFDGNVVIALAAYNKGPSAVQRELDSSSFSPNIYTQRVMQFRWVYYWLYFGYFHHMESHR